MQFTIAGDFFIDRSFVFCFRFVSFVWISQRIQLQEIQSTVLIEMWEKKTKSNESAVCFYLYVEYKHQTINLLIQSKWAVWAAWFAWLQVKHRCCGMREKKIFFTFFAPYNYWFSRKAWPSPFSLAINASSLTKSLFPHPILRSPALCYFYSPV